MRIDRLEIENFKKYEHLVLDLHPQFTLLVGENGSGKTTVLDALAVVASVWLHRVPDAVARRSRRDIQETERRTWARPDGDRLLFRSEKKAELRATGLIGEEILRWSFASVLDGTIANIPDKFRTFFDYDAVGLKMLLPVLALYGAERGSRAQATADTNGGARRWAAFKDCLSGRIDTAELTRWFLRESIERGNRQGRWRPGFDIVRQAVLRCVPGATDVRFDGDRDQIVLNIDGNIQPFDNLSAGQRMMLALVADLAIKCVTQNAYLIPPDELPQDGSLPEVLKQTPGLVLIDELDVHLHPRWQRHIVKDLKETFPAIQFVCTSHSPQIIGELKPEEIRILKGEKAYTPDHSFGIDSNRILQELMDAPVRNESINRKLDEMFQAIDEDRLEDARSKMLYLAAEIGEDEPEIIRARTLMRFLEPRV